MVVKIACLACDQACISSSPKGIATVTRLYCQTGPLTTRRVALVQQGNGVANNDSETVVFGRSPLASRDKV